MTADAGDVLEKKTIRLRGSTLDLSVALAQECGVPWSLFIRLILEERLESDRIDKLKDICRRA